MASDSVRQEYRDLSEVEKTDIQAIKACGQNMIDHISTIASHTEGSSQARTHELQLAQDRIEEAVMWAVKHITR